MKVHFSVPSKNSSIVVQMKEKQALSDHDEKKEAKEEDEAIHIWDCGSPLYDSYELVSLSHLIDRHIMVLPSLSGSRQEKSSRFSHASSHLIPSLFSSSNATKEAAASKKARGGSVLVTFLCKLMERDSWKRRICGARVEKPKKLKINSGISKVYNRINSSRK